MSNKSFELRVKIEAIGEIQELEGGFKKRDLIGLIDGEWPEYYKFEFIQNKINVPDDFIVGTYANIFFNIRGKKVESKKKDSEPMYFTTLNAWKIEA